MYIDRGKYLVYLVFSIFIQLTPLLGLFSGRLHQVHKLVIILNVLSIFLHFFPLIIFPNYLS